MMTWRDVREASDQGFEVGAHGVTHRQLDTLPPTWAAREAVDSRKQIEDHISQPVTSFCYPHGANDGTVRRLVAAAGYTTACATVPAISGLRDEPFALARVPVLRDTSDAHLAWLMESLPHAPLRERVATRVWRVARRQLATLQRVTSGRDT
jgi:peptidoglycan/xylan/chitin deacetylase (PgdA/CDA1 family)